MQIDHSVYPDFAAPPEELRTAEEKAEYVHRICGAWDYGIVPEPATFDLFKDWRAVFDAFPLPHSPAYHAVRAWFRWPPVPGSCLEADYERADAAAGRTDPCAGMI